MSLSDTAVCPPSTIDVARPQRKNDLATMLRRIGQTTGRSSGSVLGDIVKTGIGPGKLSFDEYVALGLYDPARHPGSDVRSFAGIASMERIWNEANFRTEFYGLVENKIASSALLAAHGFPTIPMAAFFSMQAGFESDRMLRSRAALRDFLAQPAHYPLFGKPMDGLQSLGSASLRSYDAASDQLIDWRGTPQGLDGFVDQVVARYSSGYLIQPQLAPHPANAALCGRRLPTVRVLTIQDGGKAKILRACEKIPAGANAADNYWRSGNLLVQLDLDNGLRGRATSGMGFEMREHTHHPDSGGAIAGTQVPNWSSVCALALEGARLFQNLGMMGWDIAPVESGAVVVEVNETPDLALPQLADRRGILDAELAEFLAARRRAKSAWRREVLADRARQRRASFWG